MVNLMPGTRLVALALGSLAAAAVIGSATAHRNPASETYRSAQAMTYTLGSKRAIGYFVVADGKCQVTLMISEAVDAELAQPLSAARLRLSMLPGESAALDSAEGETMQLTCGSGAETVVVKYGPAERS
jgi:hypothetical protein